MIFPSLYEDLDMKRYAKLATDILPESNVVTILCDDSGQIVWTDKDATKLQKLIFENCETQGANFLNDDNCCVKKTADGVNTAYFNLGDFAGCSSGVLVFYDIGSDYGCDASIQAITSNLSNIAEIVKSELGYLFEVNAMAGELGERYDELSMLRASDVALIEYRESRHILSTYIRSCGEHLRVDYAAIWIASRKEIYPGGVSYENDSTEVLQLLEQLSSDAFSLFQQGHDGFGINDKDEKLRSIIQFTCRQESTADPGV